MLFSRMRWAVLRPSALTAMFIPHSRPNQDFIPSPLGTEFAPRYGDQKINAARKVLNKLIHSSRTSNQGGDMESAVLHTATCATRDEYDP